MTPFKFKFNAFAKIITMIVGDNNKTKHIN